jgi:hypothetical protein
VRVLVRERERVRVRVRVRVQVQVLILPPYITVTGILAPAASSPVMGKLALLPTLVVAVLVEVLESAAAACGHRFHKLQRLLCW